MEFFQTKLSFLKFVISHQNENKIKKQETLQPAAPGLK